MRRPLQNELNDFGMNGYKLCESISCRIGKDNVDVTPLFASLTIISR